MCHFHSMIDCLAEFARDWVSIFSAIRPNLIGFHHKLATGSESVLTIKILRAKSFYSCSFLMHVVQIANPQYHLLPSLKFFCWYGLSDMFTKTWSGGLICVCRFQLASYCCRFVFISELFFDSDCFFNYTRLCVVLPTMIVFPTCFRHLKQDLNSKLKFLSTCWRNSPSK